MDYWIGIDNGATGSIGIIGENTTFIKTPFKEELSYTKKKQYVSRIIVDELISFFSSFNFTHEIFCLLERPMVNPKRFKQTMSAMRAYEATLIVLEKLNIPYETVDSKKWQKHLLPSGLKGRPNLKKASADIGKRLFPQFKDLIDEQGDADGILIAEYARRINI